MALTASCASSPSLPSEVSPEASPPDGPKEEPKEVGIDEALRLAADLVAERRLDAAVELCGRILAVLPEQPDALHLLGLARARMGDEAAGLAYIERSIALQPAFAGYLNNLGNIHSLAGRMEPAMQAYQRAIALAPDLADLHNNLGALYKAESRFEEALACYERALALEPHHARALNNMGLWHAAQGQLEQAVRFYLRAIEEMPGNRDSRRLLGMTWYTMGKHAQAAEVFRQWLETEPDHPVARHMYAAMSGQNVPERAPDMYVEHTFDHFADSFEQILNERLGYRAPQLCADMLGRTLAAVRPGPTDELLILDAGCGTGLCGPLLAQVSPRLAGADLSRGMLDLAATKGVYRDLYKAELTEFLHLSPGQWDIIVSADTLCYFGELHAFMRAAAGSMRPGGVLVFTVEALPDEAPQGATIQPSGRYAHSRPHLRAALADAGLAVHEIVGETLRSEGGKPVAGWVVAALKPATPTVGAVA